MKGFSPVCITLCSLILDLLPNTLPHTSQWNAPLPVCVFRWTSSALLWANPLAHISHRWGLAPVWEFMWSESSERRSYARWHISQGYRLTGVAVDIRNKISNCVIYSYKEQVKWKMSPKYIVTECRDMWWICLDISNSIFSSIWFPLKAISTGGLIHWKC